MKRWLLIGLLALACGTRHLRRHEGRRYPNVDDHGGGHRSDKR